MGDNSNSDLAKTWCNVPILDALKVDFLTLDFLIVLSISAFFLVLDGCINPFVGPSLTSGPNLTVLPLPTFFAFFNFFYV